MSQPVLEVANLRVDFGAFRAIDDVSFDLQGGETLGLVGESGSGKSTLARAVLRLIPVTSGRVVVNGGDFLAARGAELRRRRRDLQMVFQDPVASLDPRMSIGDTLEEPIKIHEPACGAARRRELAAAMLERVGLAGDMAGRFPHEFSGGQCQRIAIARAMMLQPKVLICDEPLSSLDVSIQGQIVNLLSDLQSEAGMAVLFISHNLAVVRHLCHRVLVLYRGRLVEAAERDALFGSPAHPYTRSLLAAVQEVGPGPDREAAPTEGHASGADMSTPVHGCPYHPRCPLAEEVCRTTVPQFTEVASRHLAACHRWREVVYS